MPIIDLSGQIEKLPKEFDELKPVLRQLLNAVNTHFDTGNTTRSDLKFIPAGSGPIVRRNGDGKYVRLGVSGTGASAIEFTEIGN